MIIRSKCSSFDVITTVYVSIFYWNYRTSTVLYSSEVQALHLVCDKNKDTCTFTRVCS